MNDSKSSRRSTMLRLNADTSRHEKEIEGLETESRTTDLAKIVVKVRRTFRDDICNIIRRGELLQQARDQIEHDGWLTWLETNFNWDEHMAQRAISVAKFTAKYDTVSALNLTKGVLYGLASGGFPDRVVKTLLKEATSGPIKIERFYEMTRQKKLS